MVGTRSLHGSRKRQRSPSADLSDTGLVKSRKMSKRRITSVDKQIQEEDQEQALVSAKKTIVEIPIPTKSKKAARKSLPADYQLPDSTQFESLEDSIAKRRLHRHSTLDGTVEQGLDVYIDPADLNIRPEQLMTPPNSQLQKFIPQPLALQWTPNSKREQEISEYERTIGELNEEKAALSSRLKILALGVRSLGFGEREDAEALCKTIRTAFDGVRQQEAELLPELGLQDLSNHELLQQQPELINGLSQQVEELQQRLEETDRRLVFVNAEFQGVLDKLAERDERLEAVQLLLEQTDERLVARTHELDAEHVTTQQLREDKDDLIERVEARDQEIKALHDVENDLTERNDELEAECEKLREDIAKLDTRINRLLQDHEDAMQEKEEEMQQRLGYMSQELDQEHEYRLIAEGEIATRDTAYTKLQVDYESARTKLDQVQKNLAEAETKLEQKEIGLAELNDMLDERDREKEELEEAITGLEKKVEGMSEDIAELRERGEQQRNTIQEQDRQIQEAGDLLDTRLRELKEAHTEINELRGEIFGVQQQRDQLVHDLQSAQDDLAAVQAERDNLTGVVNQKNVDISKAETKIRELDTSMVNLKKEHERIIGDKNTLLDQRDAIIEQQKEELASLRDENLRVIAERNELRALVAVRGKDIRALQEINTKLLADAEKDVLATRQWVDRKAQLVEEAKRGLATVGEAAQVVLQQDVAVVKKSQRMRDSGILGDMADTDEEEMVMENGY